jgi:uncharacterized protein YrrD
MLITIQNMLGAPVMSLQTGQPLAKLDVPIIDPRNLKIVAFYVSGPMVEYQPAVLFAEDIREFGDVGAIVDSADQITPTTDLIRLNEVIDFHFELNGIHVIDEQKRKLGKVENYTLDPDSFLIQQLYLKPTLAKSLSVAHLTVSRTQIVAIDNDKITVKTPTVREKVAKVTKTAQSVVNPEGYDNPFRKPKPAIEHAENHEN